MSDTIEALKNGLVFKGKLIGVDSVPGPRGDKMCQSSMQRLKVSIHSKIKSLHRVSVISGLRATSYLPFNLKQRLVYHKFPSLFLHLSGTYKGNGISQATDSNSYKFRWCCFKRR